MPVELGIWRLGPTIEPVQFTHLDSEAKLEDALTRDIRMLDANLMVLGSQVRTDNGKFIDILAVDITGDVCVVELKRAMTPREVVAQTLDYAAWVQQLSNERIREIYAEKHAGKAFEQGFAERFGDDAPVPDELNKRHRLLIVASHLDPSTERIIAYLAQYGVPLNAVFLRYFKEGASEYLARTWLLDPSDVEGSVEKSPASRTQESWNERDYYVSFGHDAQRAWEDARTLGFVSAGGGAWYTNSLKQLKEGDRVSVHVPKRGYVGVGVVTGAAVPARDFTVEHGGQRVRLSALTLRGQLLHDQDDERCEWMVPVRWLDTRALEQAVWEKGLFANQNSACKLRNRFTLERLSVHFKPAFEASL
ncbi:DUF91 domain-containing protein [Deinococcus yavapaiensis]|uniref:DUF91 domain-containing protein n=1 Tax=Deinococcus yavapaiensis KR-236 TaxID=694435 RepID=A0A318S4U5_9DEIO|nr:DUF91 domain-containing protein [Deinococcus yavapaiensis]PYE52010.1 hypothetical protein DES52_11356 [Deinococcus yavapaiensis KR-236]